MNLDLADVHEYFYLRQTLGSIIYIVQQYSDQQTSVVNNRNEEVGNAEVLTFQSTSPDVTWKTLDFSSSRLILLKIYFKKSLIKIIYISNTKKLFLSSIYTGKSNISIIKTLIRENRNFITLKGLLCTLKDSIINFLRSCEIS